MPDLEDLGNAMVKDMLQSTRGQFWFPWRPGFSQVKLGSYCSCNGLTATYEGDLDRFGVELTSVPAASGLTISNISSSDYHIEFAGVDQNGKAIVTTDIGKLDLSAQTTATYTYASALQYNVVLSDTQVYSLGEADAVAYLANTVWPQLDNNPSWDNHAWVVCGNVATAKSYLLAGSVASNSSFSVEAARGAAIQDLVNGSVTADLKLADAQNLDIHDTLYQGTELIVGYSLYHFDANGNPQLYTPWYSAVA